MKGGRKNTLIRVFILYFNWPDSCLSELNDDDEEYSDDDDDDVSKGDDVVGSEKFNEVNSLEEDDL